MAPKGRKRQSSTYDSDNGFVANDSGGDNGVDHRAKKKARTSKSTAATTTTAAKPSSSSFKTASSAAKPAGEGKVDANGDQYWELSRLRRVTVSSFKGRTMVNVREYYEKDGQELPGKKVGWLSNLQLLYISDLCWMALLICCVLFFLNIGNFNAN